MKIFIPFLLFLFICGHTEGQITIEATHFPTPNKYKEIQMANTNLTLSSIEGTGANYTWNFMDIERQNYDTIKINKVSSAGLIINFQFAGNSPEKYQASYFQEYDDLPFSDIFNLIPIDLPLDIQAVNRMVKIEDDKVTYPGYALQANGIDIGFRSKEIETGYVFPLTYLDTFLSKAKTRFDFSLVFDAEIIQHRKRTSIVDGYGTLKLPFTASHEVIRIHHHIEEEDSIRANLGFMNPWFAIPRTTDEYEWWSQKLQQPILKIQTEGIFGAQIIKKVTYYETPVPEGTHIFPNPAIDYFKLQSDDETLERIEVYNLEGKKVKEVEPIDAETVVNIQGLASGRYIIQTVAKNKINRFPLIIIQ